MWTLSESLNPRRIGKMDILKQQKTAWRTGDAYKKRLMDWRREPSTLRIERPTRLDRARSLGYKAKQGIFMVRQKVPRGAHSRPTIRKGRRPSTQRQKLILRKNYQQIAEERVSKKFLNCEVMNSYWVGRDGQNTWYEVIVVDINHPRIKKDKKMNLKTGKAHKGLTSAGKKSRGLRGKGKGFEKARPSRRAHDRKQ